MIAGVLLRNFKNYNNINFIPVCNNVDYKFSAYIGNNGAGKSAVLESIDVFFNDRDWNTTYGSKANEAYVCPIFLISKSKEISENKTILEVMSSYFWETSESMNATIKNTPELVKWLKYKELLKEKYSDNYYLILIGIRFPNFRDAYFATYDEDIKKYLKDKLKIESEEDVNKKLNDLKQYIKDKYCYIYVPVESSPIELLRLQNKTMQRLLNKDLLSEIEKILTKGKDSILEQINNKLNNFMDDVNREIREVEEYYEFKSEQRYKKNLSAKDIREKILEAYFPLRTLKANGIPIEQLSSGEQRKALIDVAYSILVSNGNKATDKDIIFGIDEPESSMHISNCFKHFQMLERLAKDYPNQIVITTHWYGFLPVSQNGNLLYIDNDEQGKREIKEFSLYNIMEEQRHFPDAIELKSLFDLATSIITYMRIDKETSWIICEGSDDKIYLECILNNCEKVNILPMGGCGNVIKLYRIIYSSLTDKNEDKSGNILFLIDTDKKQAPDAQTISFSSQRANVKLRRLQIESGVPILQDPGVKGTYEQTEMEDCLFPQVYFNALKNVIIQSGKEELKELINLCSVNESMRCSLIRGDQTCLVFSDLQAVHRKAEIIEFAEDDENKKRIAKEYHRLYNKINEKPEHELKQKIMDLLNVSTKRTSNKNLLDDVDLDFLNFFNENGLLGN